MPLPVRKKPSKPKPDYVRLGKRARAKGKVYQKHVANRLAEHFGLPVDELYSAMAGVKGSDVSMSRAARAKMAFSLEIKNAKTISMPAWIAQAEEQAENDGYPFLVVFKLHRRNKDYVVLELEELLKWIQ